MSGIVRMRSIKELSLLNLCLALVCLGAVAAPAAAETRPSIVVVERAMAKMSKMAEKTGVKLQRIAEKGLDQARAMAGGEPDDQRIFRIFQRRQFGLQILNFRTQQKLASVREAALKRLENLEFNPEASQMLEDAFSQASSRLQTAFSSQQSRLQTIFSVANPTEPQEPNSFRGLPDDDDSDEVGDDL